MATVLPAILCLASGFLIVSLGWRRQVPQFADLLLRTSLSAGFGLAAFSIIFFLARVFGFIGLWRIDLVVFGLLLASHFLLRGRKAGTVVLLDSSRNRSEPWPRLLTAAFLIASFAAVYSSVLRALHRPHGNGWDAFAIWNLHARFLFRDAVSWRDAFSPLIPWSHPDYPLLLPATIAHFWTFLGHEAPGVPAVIGFVFTFSTVGLLFSALEIFNGRTSALLGSIALLSSPFFIDLGTWQYADVPLSFFFLATIVLFHLHHDSVSSEIEMAKDDTQNRGNRSGQLALAGLAAGFGAWTKNEGVLFLCAVLISRLLPGHRRTSQIAPALLGIAPIFLVLVYFKHFIAPPGDLFSDLATMLQKLGTPSRYWTVLKWYGKESLRFGDWFLIPIPLLMIGFYIMVRNRIRTRGSTTLRASALTLALTLAGYFFIYLITPYDIYWHLRFSLARLFLQLWPATIFLFFLRIGPSLRCVEPQRI